MVKREKDYLYYSDTTSLCSTCKERIPAKIIIKDNSVYIKKNCKKHGEHIELREEDADWYIKRLDYDKPGTTSKLQTKVKKGCPYDCGLCSEHEQHSCIALLEVTTGCDVNCPVCFAESGKNKFLSLKKIDKMLDLFVESEFNNAEILQISGGEPTLHSKILDIIRLAKSKKIKQIMLNTNGKRIAEDIDFVRELSEFIGGFEVYLQFDGFSKKTYEYFRGKDLLKIKKKAIENLSKFSIPLTLVSTIKKGLNDDEIGDIIKFGLDNKYVRGVNLQPIAFFGRFPKKDVKNRITLTGILGKIDKQMNSMIKKEDFIPLPCNVERVAITYLYRQDDEFIPITRNVKVKDYLPMIRNTFAFSADDVMRETAKGLFTGEFCSCLSFLKEFLPLKRSKNKIKYLKENTFRISVTSFVDVYNFDLKSVQKECVHILTEDLRKIPFSTYNMLYRK